MRIAILAALLAATFSLIVPASAHAGGWSGGDSSILRAHLRQGYTLTRIWARINNR